MFDVLIKGGILVDGTGAEGREADVAIRDGRIAGLGSIDGGARRTVDARGRIVAPGFVDIHTHFDAQVFWDTTLSPAPLHGVTTIVGGNCGFSIAPLTPEAGDYLMRMLSRVEGMPLESLREGVPWDWTSFGEYLDRIDGTLAVNAGFLVGHSALRRVAMGEAACAGAASPEQLGAMVRLLDESLAAGGLGFSSSLAVTHNDGDARPVPSRHADRGEILALCRELSRHSGTALEFIPAVGPFDEEKLDLMAAMSLAANRPLNWNVLGVSAQARELREGQLAASDYARERGATVVALTPAQAIRVRINLVSGFIFDTFPGWAEVIALPLEDRKRAFADPAVRADLERGASSEKGLLSALARWETLRIEETFSEANASLEGRTVGEIAAERGVSAFDCLLDVALADDLRTSFVPPTGGDDPESWKARGEVWRDPRTLIGASDSGAHLDMLDTFTCTTSLLGTGVREKGLLGLEEAIHQLTDAPARLYGIRERGRLAEGWRADVVVFDAERIGPGPVHTRHDLPAGAARLYAEAFGIDCVFVNGTQIVAEGEFTDARPGTVLRSGRDTQTVTLAEGP